MWQCDECAAEYKRHSKSIDPAKARCGRCKGALRQTKPVPRAAAAKPSRYQEFVKEQMRIIKLEGPGGLRKDVMKTIAQRWAAAGEGAKGRGGGGVDENETQEQEEEQEEGERQDDVSTTKSAVDLCVEELDVLEVA